MEKNVRLSEIKTEIVNFLKINGPSLPNEIARKINKPLLITSAILSEMVNEKRIKISHMKIGSSPLYFLDGQENQLEKFEKYLKNKEKEALNLLKKNKILNNENLEPSIRVALSNIKDFAKPIRIKIKEKEIVFWKYFLVNNKEVEEIVKNIIEKFERHEKKVKEIKEEKTKEKKEQEIDETEKKKKSELQKKLEVTEKEESVKGEVKIDNFESYIHSNFDLVEKISNNTYTGSKEILGEVVDFLIIIKDKKRVSDSDLVMALREGQERKMPVIILTKGTLTKKAKKILEESGSLLIIKNLNKEK